MEMLMRFHYRILYLAVASICLVFMATSQASAATGEERQTFKIEFNADTKDIHVQINGPIKKKHKTTPHSDGDGVGPHPNQWSFTWLTAPGAQQGKGKVELSRQKRTGKNGGWKFKYWRTTDGSTTWPTGDPVPTSTVSMFTTTHGDPSVELGFENLLGSSNVAVSNITLTVISDLSLLDSPNWDSATGIDYLFPDGIIQAGSEVSWNPDMVDWIPVTSTDWVKVTAMFDGVQQTYGAPVKAVPEPASLALVATFSLGLLVIRNRQRA